jgi:hypothetical protein
LPEFRAGLAREIVAAQNPAAGPERMPFGRPPAGEKRERAHAEIGGDVHTAAIHGEQLLAAADLLA